mmetsp:Transcript_60525/g.171420  ORF Transcript_60525/g.171420 Transcript_60525/m.171420 type:complete len:287 (-) Transcript_60525:42-902(-)
MTVAQIDSTWGWCTKRCMQLSQGGSSKHIHQSRASSNCALNLPTSLREGGSFLSWNLMRFDLAKLDLSKDPETLDDLDVLEALRSAHGLSTPQAFTEGGPSEMRGISEKSTRSWSATWFPCSSPSQVSTASASWLQVASSPPKAMLPGRGITGGEGTTGKENGPLPLHEDLGESWLLSDCQALRMQLTPAALGLPPPDSKPPPPPIAALHSATRVFDPLFVLDLETLLLCRAYMVLLEMWPSTLTALWNCDRVVAVDRSNLASKRSRNESATSPMILVRVRSCFWN